MGDRGGLRGRVRGGAAGTLLRAAEALDARSRGDDARPRVTVAASATVRPDVVFAPDPQGRSHPIVVGPDCWLGRGVRVLSGVTIGAGAIVRPYSVVAHDVRPFAIVAGNPAAEVERRFDDAVVDALLAVAWWEWTPVERAARAEDLASDDVVAFLARYG